MRSGVWGLGRCPKQEPNARTYVMAPCSIGIFAEKVEVVHTNGLWRSWMGEKGGGGPGGQESYSAVSVESPLGPGPLGPGPLGPGPLGVSLGPGPSGACR